jgi:hypothetical protein
MKIQAVFRIRIRIRKFLDHPDPDPLVRDTDPDPSIIKQNSKENLDFYCFVTSLWHVIFKVISKKTMILWYGSPWYRSANPDPDPYQHGTDPEYWIPESCLFIGEKSCTQKIQRKAILSWWTMARPKRYWDRRKIESLIFFCLVTGKVQKKYYFFRIFQLLHLIIPQSSYRSK